MGDRRWQPQVTPVQSGFMARLKRALFGTLAIVVVGLIFLNLTWHTFFKYVGPGEMMILISKDGAPLEPGQILARPGQKGIQEDVYGEGRHFVMPVVNEVEIVKCVEVKPGNVGVVTAKTGKEAAAGKILVDVGEKGVWKDVLPPGRYRLNPHGYEVKESPAVEIHAGHVGFVTSLVGSEPRGAFAGEGERGMRRDTLEPGIYYLNPYAYRVDEIAVGISQVSFLDEHVIRFPSADAFEITLEASVEWELHPNAVADVMAEFGTPQAIEDKVISPQSKSIGRLAGSRYGAKDFLLGEGREKFQQAFTEELEKICQEKHLDVHSAFIRHILIPSTLTKPIQEAFISVEMQKTAKFKEETRKTQADLEREQALITQRTQEVEAQTGALVTKISAQAEQEVGQIEAQTRQMVALKQKE
ncbi:MAG TPA: SPFH domain-containing protein, partial [Planctomycetota bacterium]|nr:SPFH domain-containing protein [Planctomycetota bacterium]